MRRSRNKWIDRIKQNHRRLSATVSGKKKQRDMDDAGDTMYVFRIVKGFYVDEREAGSPQKLSAKRPLPLFDWRPAKINTALSVLQ